MATAKFTTSTSTAVVPAQVGWLSTEELHRRYPLSMTIKSAADLKKLSPEEVKALGSEYRDYLIEVCSKNGGHLGPSLGVVELTFALHRVFETPKDKIVWDIGHQSYPHKMITGRFERLQTLRQEEGVSGFCRRHESEHDMFGAGHAGTSISAAVGFAVGHHRKNDPHKVVAVIGDASLTAGMAYEALHQRQEWKNNLIVILNDNEMSISPNVGAVNAFLTQKTSSPFLSKLQDELRHAVEKIPVVGNEISDMLSRVKQSIKKFLVPQVIFEGLGFKYIGPLDGHDVALLTKTLEHAKSQNEPILIHIMTEKGRGYAPALADKVTFHGCGPYDRETGKLYKEPGNPAYTKVFADTLTKMAKRDSRIVAITGAMPSGTGLAALEKELPQQVYDVGISEQHAVTFAGGLAIEGTKPYVVIYSTFMQRAYDQIIHDICIQKLNVKFCMDRAGFVGADGATHHGVLDISFMRLIPEMTLCAPKDERELQELIVALDQHEGPDAIRYPRGEGLGYPLYEKLEDIRPPAWGTGEAIYMTGAPKSELPPDAKEEAADLKNKIRQSLPIEWVERMVRSNKAKVDVILVGFGSTVKWSVQAADLLKAKGINALVVNARWAKPLDKVLFEKLTKICKNMVTVEENVGHGGFGSAVLEFYQSADLLSGLHLKCLAIPDEFYEQATQTVLQKVAGIDPDSIAAAAEALVQRVAESEGKNLPSTAASSLKVAK